MQRRGLGRCQHGTRFGDLRLSHQMPAIVNLRRPQFRLEDFASPGRAILHRKCQRQRFRALAHTAREGVAVQLARHHIQLAILPFAAVAANGAHLAVHMRRIIGGDTYKGILTRRISTVERNREAVFINDCRTRRSTEALGHIVPRPARRHIVTGKNGGVDNQIAFDMVNALLLYRRHHVAQILTA